MNNKEFDKAVCLLNSGLSLRSAAAGAGVSHSTFYSRLKALGIETNQSDDWYRKRLLSKLEKQNNGCWIWTGGLDKDGYGQASYNGKNIRAHRLSYQLFVGPIPDGMLILHQCDIKPCCCPEHIRPGTVLENTQDAVIRNRYAVGEKQHLAVLTESLVIQLRKDAKHCSYNELGRRHNIDSNTVRRAVTGETWKHITTGISK